jgi:hypothetical protein
MADRTKAAHDVLAERQRQIQREGWSAAHDDEHDDGSLARAAAAYCLTGTDVPVLVRLGGQGMTGADRPIWPWRISDYRPKTRRADLVRAAALILAEIERIDRAHDGVIASRPARCPQCKREGFLHSTWCPVGMGADGVGAIDAVAELRAIRNSLQFANDSPGGGISDTLWMMGTPETVFDALDRVIERLAASGVKEGS